MSVELNASNFERHWLATNCMIHCVFLLFALVAHPPARFRKMLLSAGRQARADCAGHILHVIRKSGTTAPCPQKTRA